MTEPPSEETLIEAVRRIVAELLKVPPEEKLARLKQRISELPPELREPAEILVLQTEAIVDTKPPDQKWEKIAIFVFGVVFVATMLLIALFVKYPTPFQLFVFRIVVALAGAGIGALIPGFLNIESTFQKASLRAGGALAIFVIIYTLNPPKFLIGP